VANLHALKSTGSVVWSPPILKPSSATAKPSLRVIAQTAGVLTCRKPLAKLNISGDELVRIHKLIIQHEVQLFLSLHIQGVSEGIVNILGGGSPDYSE
jgi:hypothetical protein